jgi:RND superfamily putative drug exporter
VGPITVLAKGHDADFKSRQGQARIAQLTREFYELRYVDSRGVACRPILRVRSLTNPLGDALGSYSPFTPAGRRHIAVRKNRRAVATYLSDAPGFEGNVTRLDLVCQYDPFSRESVRLLDRIDAKLQELRQDPSSAWYGSEFDFVGTTAGIRDLEAVNRSDYFRIGLLTSLAVLAVLVAVLRRPLVSVYLVLTVLLGFFVSIGVTKLVFMAIYGATFHGLDWKLPLFLFVILVAVGEDYNIYLATRVVEEQRRRGAIEGLRVAVVRTGGIITSCGVIMAGTFASMMTGTLRGMHELGFSLAFGVLLDTFVIRTILVPAFLALWARWLPHTVPPKQATATAKLEPD